MGNSLETSTLGPFPVHHALEDDGCYQVSRLTGGQPAWQEMGTLVGSELQRVTIRLNAKGYALYRFQRTR